MTFQAKMKCTSVEQYEGVQEIWNFSAVNNADGKGNESWAKWTPSGNLKMVVTNPSLIGTVKPGDYYLLNFEKVSAQ